MLIRRYRYQIESGNDEIPFLFQNTDIYSDRQYDIDIENPSAEEVAAPGLTIRCRSSDETEFWQSFHSGFVNQDLPDDVMAALRGSPSPWKIIRCTPSVSHNEYSSSAFFVLANPDRYAGSHRNNSLAEELADGLVWVFLTCEHPCMNLEFDLYVPCAASDRSAHYTIALSAYSRYCITEYYPDGRFYRHSEFTIAEGNTAADNVLVTEFLDP